MHCGCLQENPQFLRIRSEFVPPKELEISEDALDSHISATATGSLLNKRTGLSLEYHQLQYLKQRKRNDLVMEARSSLNQSKEQPWID